jgi:AraC-like DNA-binding protein
MRLYQSAAHRDGSLKPLWHVGNARMLFAGCLDRNALHSHSTAVLLASLYEDFELRVGNEAWATCRMAVIRAGTPYEFDAGGRPLAVVYAEPNAVSAEGLAALVRDVRELPGALIGRCGEVAAIRAIYEDPDSPRWVASAVADLIDFSNSRGRRHIDPRIARAIERVACDDRQESDGGAWPSVTAAARNARLSTSRFQHVFKAEVGVSYRRYLCWLRMRTAVRDIVEGSNLTMAAHGAGYCDQAHFAHEFRRIFGAPASRSLANVRR